MQPELTQFIREKADLIQEAIKAHQISLTTGKLQTFSDFIDTHAKQPILTTEDGCELFKGDEYHLVWVEYPSNGDLLYNVYSHKEIEPLEEDESWSKKAKYFSTKKAADNYIIQNKPLTSVKEQVDAIINHCGLREEQDNRVEEVLTELAKSKL